MPYDCWRSSQQSVRKHLPIIEAVKRLERQWSNPELFHDLGAKIIAMYGEDRMTPLDWANRPARNE
jgi:hypothetical protein